MIRYYLMLEVELVGEPEDGWQWAKWPNGKVWKHWAAQLCPEPWAC